MEPNFTEVLTNSDEGFIILEGAGIKSFCESLLKKTVTEKGHLNVQCSRGKSSEGFSSS